MKKFFIIFLAVLLPFNALNLASKNSSFENSAHAAVIAAPFVAIGSLELLILSVGTAATLGIITAQAANQYRREIQGMIDQIRRSSSDAWDSMKWSVLAMYERISAAIRGGGTVTCDPPRVTIAQATPRAEAQPRVQPIAQPRVVPRTQICNQSPRECCQQLMSRFSQLFERREARINQRAYKIWKGSKTNKSYDCCLEWDSTHGAWEIFNSSGVHQGERYCDDMNEDICARTPGRGAHAEPDPAGHQPRDCAPLRRSAR